MIDAARGWKVYVTRTDKLARFERVVFYRPIGEHTFEYISNFTEGGTAEITRVELEPNAMIDDDIGFDLPVGVLDAAAEFMNPPVDRSAEIKRLEEALEKERGRVDQVLEARAWALKHPT